MLKGNSMLQVAASLGPRNVVPAVPLGSARLPAVSIAQPQLGVFRTAALRLKTSGRRLQPTQQLLLSWQQAACPLQLELARYGRQSFSAALAKKRHRSCEGHKL